MAHTVAARLSRCKQSVVPIEPSPFDISYVGDKDDLTDCWNRLTERELTVAEAIKERELQLAKDVPFTKKNNFACAVGVLIVANAVCMGVEADNGKRYPTLFKASEHVFTSAFVIELGLRWYCEGIIAYFGEAMNSLDCFLVVSAVVDTWLISATNLNIDLRMMSLLRLLRLTRLVRLFRLFRLFKELSVITMGFIKSQRTLLWASVFLVIIVYTFAVFAKLKIGNSCQNDVDSVEDDSCIPSYTFGEGFPDQKQLFGTVGRSMLTLFVCFSEGCGMDIIWPMSLATPWVMVFWYLFIMVTAWGIMNIIVGIFCENIIDAVDNVERDLKRPKGAERNEKVLQLRSMFKLLDSNDSGAISRSEWNDGIRHSEDLQEFISNLGLHDFPNIFDTLDTNGSGELNFREFFDGITLLLQGEEPAKAKDLVSTFLLVKSTSERLGSLDQKIGEMQKEMGISNDGHSSCSSSRKDQQRCNNEDNKEAVEDVPPDPPGPFGDTSMPPNLQQDIAAMHSQIGLILHKVDSGFQAMQCINERIAHLEKRVVGKGCIPNNDHGHNVLD